MPGRHYELCLSPKRSSSQALGLSYCRFLLHMRKKILKAPCLLLSLFTTLSLCRGKFTTPITDDVSRLSSLKQNLPSDYEIPVSYVPREEAGACWVVLNIYPLEQSLHKLADMFGASSSNKEHILVFITMLKDLRFTFDHEELEAVMQVSQCHYQESRLASGLYFDHINDILHAAARGTPSFSCELPPCHSPETPGGQEEGRGHSWSKRTPFLLALIPFAVCIVVIVWLVKTGRLLPRWNSEHHELESSDDTVPAVSLSIPLETLSQADDPRPAGEAIPEHRSG